MRKELYLQEQVELDKLFNLEKIEYIRLGYPYIQSANKCSICELRNKCFYYETVEYSAAL